LSSGESRALEPLVKTQAALISLTTDIVDSHGLTAAPAIADEIAAWLNL